MYETRFEIELSREQADRLASWAEITGVAAGEILNRLVAHDLDGLTQRIEEVSGLTLVRLGVRRSEAA